jgi:arsenate reductase
MFKNPAIFRSHHIRSGSNLFLSEVVATAGLLFLIQLLGFQKKGVVAPIAVAAWIGGAYFFTSSTSFANPAVTFARAWSDTFSGIALRSVPAFVLAQFIGGSLGVALSYLFKEPTHER